MNNTLVVEFTTGTNELVKNCFDLALPHALSVGYKILESSSISVLQDQVKVVLSLDNFVYFENVLAVCVLKTDHFSEILFPLSICVSYVALARNPRPRRHFDAVDAQLLLAALVDALECGARRSFAQIFSKNIVGISEAVTC